MCVKFHFIIYWVLISGTRLCLSLPVNTNISAIMVNEHYYDRLLNLFLTWIIHKYFKPGVFSTHPQPLLPRLISGKLSVAHLAEQNPDGEAVAR